MDLQTFVQEVRKIGYETISLDSGKKLKIDIPSVKEILDFTADKNYTVQITVTLIEV